MSVSDIAWQPCSTAQPISVLTPHPLGLSNPYTTSLAPPLPCQPPARTPFSNSQLTSMLQPPANPQQPPEREEREESGGKGGGRVRAP
eukprot:595147-Rhodomonas_salina.1